MVRALRVVPARAADPTVLLELTAALRRTLRARGEHLPASWPEEAVGDLKAGRIVGCLVEGLPTERALGLLSPREHRGFAQVHVDATDGRVDLAARAMESLIADIPPPIDRLDLGVSGLEEGEEGELAAAFAGRVGCSAIRRFGLRRPITLGDLPPDPVLPAGWSFASAGGVPVAELTRIDVAAFEGGPDAAFLADTPEGDQELLAGILGGQLGRLLEEASPAVLTEKGIPVAFALTVEASARSALLADVAVRPDLKGHGLGRALLDRTVRGLAALGHGELRLWVTEANASAHQLYISTGFRPESTAYVYRWTRQGSPTAHAMA
jgi:GNAT superfamily N-acetyltransferase